MAVFLVQTPMFSNGPAFLKKTNRLIAALDNGDGASSLASILTGLVFDAAQAYLDAYLSNGTVAQKQLPHQANEFLDEGTFSFESDTSSKVLDVVGGSMNDGAAVQIYTSNGLRAQKRYLSKITGLQTEYEIKRVGSRKVFSLTDGGWFS